MSDPARIVPEPAPRDTARPDGLDGFRVEVDAARERVDIILDRPPQPAPNLERQPRPSRRMR